MFKHYILNWCINITFLTWGAKYFSIFLKYMSFNIEYLKKIDGIIYYFLTWNAKYFSIFEKYISFNIEYFCWKFFSPKKKLKNCCYSLGAAESVLGGRVALEGSSFFLVAVWQIFFFFVCDKKIVEIIHCCYCLGAAESLYSVGELPSKVGQQLKHLVKQRPRRAKTRQSTKPMGLAVTEEEDISQGTVFFAVLAIFSYVGFNDMSDLGILFSYYICELLCCTCLEYTLILSLLFAPSFYGYPNQT